ncbi:MAG: ribose-phosphate diphosphokinase [Candidatus Thermoplasmatota archaeon]
MIIIPGSTSNSIASDIAKTLKKRLIKPVIKRFPDNELYIQIPEPIADEDIVIVQNTYPDQNIIELLLLQDAAYEAKAQTITVIIPYYGYGRQDKKFQEGEPISARALAEHISIHADNIITIDPHKEHILRFFNIPSEICTPLHEIADYLKMNITIDIVLAPDKGAYDRAKKISKLINADVDVLDKKRIDGYTVQMTPKNLDVKDKRVVIVDDIISTGGTMTQAIKELKRQGAKEISVVCTHGLFIEDAEIRIKNAGCDNIISTDTIETKYSKVKTAPSLIPSLKKLIK